MNQLDKGKKLFNEDKFEEALTLFTSFLAENKNHGDALFFRGLTNRKIGKFQDSIDDLTLLIKRLPDEADLYSERGVSYYHLKEYKTALEETFLKIFTCPSSIRQLINFLEILTKCTYR